MPQLRTILVGTKYLDDKDADQALLNLVEGDEIELRREPDNKIDPERAVACWFRGRKLGYIPSKSSFDRAVLDDNRPCRCIVADRALTQGTIIRELPRLWIEWKDKQDA